MFKKIVRLETSTAYGAILYREVYDNGTKSIWMSASFGADDRRVAEKIKQLERGKIGRKVRV